MSRIGKRPINLPNGVKASFKGNLLTLEGPKGKLEQDIVTETSIELNDDHLIVNRVDDSKKARAMHGLVRSLVSNMVEGVSAGFEKKLEIVGVGYRAALKGKNLDLSLGYSHPVVVEPPQGIDFEVEGTQVVVVKGIDKQLVGQTAADIRKLRKPEPYKGKGVRYQGEHIMRKAGKAGK